MAQIKIIVTEEEKTLLQRAASLRGISLSSYAHSLLFDTEKPREPHLTKTLNFRDCTRISLTLPRELLHALEEEAAGEKISRSQYIVRLLVQKGKPVRLTCSVDWNAILSEELRSFMSNVNYIAWAAKQENNLLYPAEMDSLLPDLKAACEKLLEASWRCADLCCSEIEKIKAALCRMN